MISFEPIKNKSLTGIKRLEKKDVGRSKFGSKTKDVAHNNGDSIKIANINPFLFLQEVDEYKEDQQRLKEVGSQLLKYLNDIRFGLINGELSEYHILNLQNSLRAQQHNFKSSELQEVINDILLRCEVELAKIEMNAKR